MLTHDYVLIGIAVFLTMVRQNSSGAQSMSWILYVLAYRMQVSILTAMKITTIDKKTYHQASSIASLGQATASEILTYSNSWLYHVHCTVSAENVGAVSAVPAGLPAMLMVLACVGITNPPPKKYPRLKTLWASPSEGCGWPIMPCSQHYMFQVLSQSNANVVLTGLVVKSQPCHQAALVHATACVTVSKVAARTIVIDTCSYMLQVLAVDWRPSCKAVHPQTGS